MRTIEKISEMAPAASVGTSDLIPIVQGLVNKKATISQVGAVLATIPTAIAPIIGAFGPYGVLVGTSFFALTPNDSGSAARSTNTTTLQSAIDFAYNNGVKKVIISAGSFYFNPPIYLDAPGNLRSNINTPTIFNFSLALIGSGCPLGQTPQGTTLNTLDNTQPALIIGPGQGMAISDFGIISQASFTSRSALPVGGMGIAVSGGSGGAHFVNIERMQVSNFFYGITGGWNNGSLADQICGRDNQITGNYIGFRDFTANCIIHKFDNCNFNENTYAFWNTVSHNINIEGGNYSSVSGLSKTFTIGSVSALSSFTDSNAENPLSGLTNYEFTVVISNSDQHLQDGAYDCFVIPTTNYGYVPLLTTAFNASNIPSSGPSANGYNSGTQTLSLKLLPQWLNTWFEMQAFNINMISQTSLLADLQAATTLYACERMTVCRGGGFNVSGVHVENPGNLTALINSASGFNSSRHSKFTKLFNNYDPSQGNLVGGAAFACQQVHAYIGGVNNIGMTFEDCDFGCSGNPTQGAIVIECGSQGDSPIEFKGCSGFPWVSLMPVFDPMIPGQGTGWAGGNVKFSSTPFVQNSSSNGVILAMGFYGSMGGNSPTPFLGWFPHPSSNIKMPVDAYQAIASGPPAIGTSHPIFPPLHGQSLYAVTDWGWKDGSFAGQVSDFFLFKSAHRHFSWGQNLSTVVWSTKSGSTALTVSDFSDLFSGLGIVLSYASASNNHIITGVYPALGYVTVWPPIGGVVGTGYSATGISQESYSILAILANSAPNTQSGSTYSVTITDTSVIANNASGTQTLTLLAAAAYPGRRLRVKTIQNQTVVSASSNVVPLAGGAAGTAILSGTAGKWADLESDGSNWNITAAN